MRPFANPLPDRSVRDTMERLLRIARENPATLRRFGIHASKIGPYDLSRDCPDCRGTGFVQSPLDGSYRKCYGCDGRRRFERPDWDAIYQAITTRRGAQPGQLLFRRSAPSSWEQRQHGSLAARAYYVWRIARFHGGADVTMPVMADADLGSDPYKPELDVMADLIAVLVYGTSFGAAARWGAAFGYLSYQDAYILTGGLPTAACGGPVHDGHKPAEELVELLG